MALKISSTTTELHQLVFLASLLCQIQMQPAISFSHCHRLNLVVLINHLELPDELP